MRGREWAGGGRVGGWRSSLLVFVATCLASAGPAEGRASQLRVATCAGTYPPFVFKNFDGSLIGLEVEMFRAVYGIMMQQVRAINASEVFDLVGDTGPPDIQQIPGFPEQGIPYLVNGTVDIYFCGAYMTVDRCEYLDFGPPTIASGYTMIVSARDARASWQDVQIKAFGKPNALGIYTIVVMIFMNLAFAHCVWACERRYNGEIRPIYGPGIYDAFWLGFITATTVGYGDKTPKTVLGRIVTIFWMLTGTYLMGLFAAAITSGFITQQLLEIKEQAPLSKPSDLMGVQRRVGAAFPKAGDALRRDAPGVVITDFVSPREAYRALALGRIDVLVDDTTMATYTVGNDPEFRGMFTLQGDKFGQVDYGFLLSMPGGQSHPIYTHFYRAVFEYLSGESRLVAASRMQKWFGQNQVIVPKSFSEVMADMLTQTNVQMAWVIFCWVIVWCTATYVTRPQPTTVEKMNKAFVLALRLEDFEFNRHVVKRAAEELFIKIDTDDSKTIDIDEVVNALKLYSNFEHPDIPLLFAAECKRVLSFRNAGDIHPAASAGSCSRRQTSSAPRQSTGLFARLTAKLGVGEGIGKQLDTQMGEIASEFDRVGSTLRQNYNTVVQQSMGAVSGQRGSNKDPNEGSQPRMPSAAMTVELSMEEFTKVIMHIVLEGAHSSQSDTTVAKQHHVLHVHDEIRRQLDVMDYKAKMIEWLLEGGASNDGRAGPPPIPQGTPSGALRRAQSSGAIAPISRGERLQFMENRWRQAVGEEPLAASTQLAGVDGSSGGGPQAVGVPGGPDGRKSSEGRRSTVGADVEESLHRLQGWRGSQDASGAALPRPVSGATQRHLAAAADVGGQNQMC